jgi:photosystem II stability/assembly factor-like uncharacterized protein
VRALEVAFAASALTLALLYTPLEARANGRFPKAQSIVLPARGDGSTIYLRATFGVLVSRDAGKSWHWLCENALGFSSTWDPPIAATRDGRLWVGLTDGMHATRDGCAIEDVSSLKGELVADLAVDGSGEKVLAVTSPPGKPAFVWTGQASAGALPAFTRVGAGVSGFRFDTIEVAASRPSRVYLTAVVDGRGKAAHLFRSDDGGKTLEELSPALPNDPRLYVSAVDPRDPDRIYVRALAATGSDVLLSTDGGKTLTSVLHMKGAMFGFARTPDGSVLYAGSGDPAEGIWRSLDRGVTWEPRAKTSVFCLNAEGPRLLVCSNPYTPGGYAVAESSDQGATVRTLATFDDVAGPVECDAGPSPCASSWPQTRAAIAASAHVPQPTLTAAPPTAPRDASGPPDGGPSPGQPHAGACGCRVVRAASDGEGTPFAAALLALAALAALARTAGRNAHPWIGSSPEAPLDGPPP